jgi:hypothetical protein
MMKKDEKDMNYPEDFKLGKGDREFADANNKGLVVNYSDAAVKLCHWYKDDAKEHSGFTYVYIEFAFGWSPVAELEFDFDADGWWHGSYFFNSGKEISEFWQSELGINLYAKEQAERQKEIDSLINAHICEVSEGMMSLSHVG